MCKQALTVCLSLGMVFGLVQSASADLVGHWAFDDGAGAIAADSSGNGNDGVIESGGDSVWVEGQLGGGVALGNGVWVTVAPEAWIPIDNQFTVAFWAFGYDGLGNNWGFFATGGGANRVAGSHTPWGNGQLYFDSADASGAWQSERINAPMDAGLATGVWTHYAFTKNADTGDKHIYVNGELFLSGTGAVGPVADITEFIIGAGPNGANQYLGVIDDFQLYDVALTQAEIQVAMVGVSRELASVPTPEDSQIDVLRNVILSWTPGEFAASHNVYLSNSFDDVNEGAAAALLADDITETAYDPGRLTFGKQYFWRVDEVNGTPDKTVFKGDVWSFEVEPYSIQIPANTIAVTASSVSNESSIPEKTIDGSGLGATDAHGIVSEDMWFTAAVDLDPWIQYEFDVVKKLDTMTVWNSNSAAEMAIGWGVKDVEIAYSEDGENWNVLADANQFSRAPGFPTYDQPDEVAFDGVAAKFVRLNIASNWGGILMSYGLSEVQFNMIPAAARTPELADGAGDVVPNVVVSWRAGREAAESTIYLSTDPNEVADGLAPSLTSNTNSADLSSLDLEMSTTYYWRVDEVNEAEAVSVWAGPVWSFSTVDALNVDDFESYGNVSPDRPFQAWLDGFGYSADEFFPQSYAGNGTGSGAGHDIWSLSSPQYDGDIMEGTIVVDGSGQSMPIYYDNASGSSHVDRTFATAQDWTTNGVQTLGLSFFGDTSNSGTLYLEINGTKVTYDLDPDALKQAEWHFWAIDLASVATNLQSVTSLSIGVEGSGSGMLYVDNMALYAKPIEYIEPVQPGTANLVAQYSFEGNYGDSSGNGNTLTEVGGVAIVNDADRGNVAVFNGLDAALQVPVIGDGTTEELTIATWFRLDIEHTGALWSVFHSDDWTSGDLHAHIGGTANIQMGVNGLGGNIVDGSVTVGQWYHLTYVAGPDAIALYVNGVLAGQSAGDPAVVFSLGEGTLGAWSNGAMERFIGGSMDDVRIYTEALSAEEIAGLAGRTTMYKPF